MVARYIKFIPYNVRGFLLKLQQQRIVPLPDLLETSIEIDQIAS